MWTYSQPTVWRRLPSRSVKGRVVVAVAATADALAGAALVPAQLLDVDVHELARARALEAARLLETEPAEPAHAQASEDAGHGRERHVQQLGDLGTAEAQPAQRRDRLDPLDRCPVGHAPRGRGVIGEPLDPLLAIAADPLARTAHAHACGLGRRLHRPPFHHDPLRQPPPTVPTERRVTVKHHP